MKNLSIVIILALTIFSMFVHLDVMDKLNKIYINSELTKQALTTQCEICETYFANYLGKRNGTKVIEYKDKLITFCDKCKKEIQISMTKEEIDSIIW